jgi:hypothetical protein
MDKTGSGLCQMAENGNSYIEPSFCYQIRSFFICFHNYVITKTIFITSPYHVVARKKLSSPLFLNMGLLKYYLSALLMPTSFPDNLLSPLFANHVVFSYWIAQHSLFSLHIAFTSKLLLTARSIQGLSNLNTVTAIFTKMLKKTSTFKMAYSQTLKH